MYTRASRSVVDYNDNGDPWEKDSSSVGYDVSELEANRYYYGIRGPRRRGPKLIFRTSSDVFTAPSGPEQEPRLMRLIPVYEHHILSKENLWSVIRSKIVEILDNRSIQHSSIDIVRFGWIEEKKENKVNEDEEDDKDFEDFNIKVAPHETLITTPITIWVGVLPDTVTGEVAFHASKDILNLLKEHDISDIDVAYRESVVKRLHGPALLAPVSDTNPLKAVIDPVTTALGLPIAGLKTLDKQGTMGFYFRVGEDLYAVTARHVLFPEDEENGLYDYTRGPKRDVVLMGTNAFNSFMESIHARIETMETAVNYWETKRATALKRLEHGGSNADSQQAANLSEAQHELRKSTIAVEELQKFFKLMEKEWAKPKDRVIGHVVWAPPISFSTAPHNYTKDVCVVRLDRKKFSNFRGNVLDLGPDIDPIEFIQLMKPHINARSDFKYPEEGLLKLEGILSAEEIRTPKCNPIRHVIKHGLTTKTTIGRLSGFESHIRYYSLLGSHDSVEAAIYPYDNTSGPFSKGGGSGSLIVNSLGKFVALLTSGAGPTDSSDITYGSPIYWLWELIKERFPSANLYFEDDDD